MFYDELKNMIFAELPKSWDYYRKATFANKIMDKVRAHCEKMQAELNDLDEVIDRLVFEKGE